MRSWSLFDVRCSRCSLCVEVFSVCRQRCYGTCYRTVHCNLAMRRRGSRVRDVWYCHHESWWNWWKIEVSPIFTRLRNSRSARVNQRFGKNGSFQRMRSWLWKCWGNPGFVPPGLMDQYCLPRVSNQKKKEGGSSTPIFVYSFFEILVFYFVGHKRFWQSTRKTTSLSTQRRWFYDTCVERGRSRMVWIRMFLLMIPRKRRHGSMAGIVKKGMFFRDLLMRIWRSRGCCRNMMIGSTIWSVVSS